MIPPTLVTLKNSPKTKKALQVGNTRNGDGKGQDFSLLHLLVKNAPNNPPHPQQLLVKPEI